MQNQTDDNPHEYRDAHGEQRYRTLICSECGHRIVFTTRADGLCITCGHASDLRAAWRTIQKALNK